MYNGVLVLSIHVSPMFYLPQLCAVLRLNEKISVFRVTGLKILSRVCTHFFSFSGKIIILCISLFKNRKIIFFRKTGKNF